MEIDFTIAILIALVGVGANFVQRVSGFGLGIFAMLFLPYFLPSPVVAATISCLLSCTTTTYNAIKYHKQTPYKTILPILISAFIVIPFAVYFATKVPDRIFEIILGVMLIILSLYFLFLDHRISFKASASKGAFCGAIGGILNGLFSTGGPPVVLYLTHATNDKQSYFAGIQFYFCLTNLYSIAMRAINGLVTLELIIYSAIGAVGCLIGDLIGIVIFNKLDGAKLKKIIYVGMVISGAIMIIK